MEDVAREIVDTAIDLGCQDAVADVAVDRNYQIRFAQNQVVISNRWRGASADVFLAYDKRIVTAEIKNLSKVRPNLERLVKVAKASQPNPLYRGIARGPFKYRVVRPDKKVLDLTDGSDYVRTAINAALGEGATECAGSFWRNDVDHFLHTSNGAGGRDHRASLYLSIRALASPEASGHGVSCATRARAFDPEGAGHKAGKIAKLAKDPVRGEAGKFDILFDPLICGSLVDEVGVLSSAFYVQAGLSPFAGKVGKRVASERVTIVDDGTADSINRRRFDAEGVRTRKTTVVQKGVLKTHLHNTSTARKFRTRTTANAGLVIPMPHALEVKAGDRKRSEMFDDMRDGLWLTNTWYTRYQSYATGDFSTIPRDGIFRIKKGEIVGAWKDIRLTDNLIRVWKSVAALSRERDQVLWWGEVSVPTFAPYAVAKKIGITRSAE